MIRIALLPTGNAIIFPDDDAGDRLDQIEAALMRAAGLRRKRTWSSPVEDIRLLGGRSGDVLLRWDGYFTEVVVAKSSRASLLDLIQTPGGSAAFMST